MKRYLLIDIGAGTMDVLVYDQADGLHYKAVAVSPARLLAAEIAAAPGPLIIGGREMGGGRLAGVLRRRARREAVAMTGDAAATIHHNPEKVRALGIDIVSDAEAAALAQRTGRRRIDLADLDVDRLRRIVTGLGVGFRFDAVAICAQDHGVAPAGVSHLDYRHQLFGARLADTPYPHALLFGRDEIPETFNRLRSIAASAGGLPAREVYVMDSGMAAVLGASLDSGARGIRRIAVLDIATSHTVAATLEDGAVCGLAEYHTADLTPARLGTLLPELADGRLTHEGILAEGGHGATLLKAYGFDAVERIVVTGPKRSLMREVGLALWWGAPWGDNMMTGTVGLLAAVLARSGQAPPAE
jgi:uncharacterized protein (DUF1786 family)